MKLNEQQAAQQLYFQTDISKSKIAEFLGISRRTLHAWIQENNWDRLKNSAEVIPAFLAENCYQVLGNLTRHLLSEERKDKPVTPIEVNAIYKLTLTINKLKTKNTLNENMETFARFTDHLLASDPSLAENLHPHIETFIAAESRKNPKDHRPIQINDDGFIPKKEEVEPNLETHLDRFDELFWSVQNQTDDAPSSEVTVGPTTPERPVDGVQK